MQLSSSQISTYQEEGALIIRRAFTGDFISNVLEALNELVTRFAKECRISFREYIEVINQWRDLWKFHSLFEGLIFGSLLPKVAAQLMDRPAVRLLHDHVISKPLGNSAEVPWHQDYPYWPVDQNFGLSCWLALDDVNSESGALEIITGSHLNGEEPPVDFLQTIRTEFNHHPNRKIMPVKKGDIVVLHSLTWHRTAPNVSLPHRRAYLSLWIPPESRYQPLHANWHPVNENVSVQPGERLNEDWFPVIGEGNREDWWELPPGRLAAHASEILKSKLSMFNASLTTRKKLEKLFNDTGIEFSDGLYEHLIRKSNRQRFIKSLNHQSGIAASEEEAEKCLKMLAINSIAWKHHKARNIYNAGYARFQEIFG